MGGATATEMGRNRTRKGHTMEKREQKKKKAISKGTRGHCTICGNVERKLVQDHEHATGQIRGVICGGCNSMLGFARDDEETLYQGIRYLRYWRGKWREEIDMDRDAAYLRLALRKKEVE